MSTETITTVSPAPSHICSEVPTTVVNVHRQPASVWKLVSLSVVSGLLTYGAIMAVNAVVETLTNRDA